MVDIQSANAENRRGKKEEKETTAAAKYNGLPYWATIMANVDVLDLRKILGDTWRARRAYKGAWGRAPSGVSW